MSVDLQLGILKVLVNVSGALVQIAERMALGREAARSENAGIMDGLKDLSAGVEGLRADVQALQRAVGVQGHTGPVQTQGAVQAAPMGQGAAPVSSPTATPSPAMPHSPSPWTVALAFIQQPQGIAALCALLLALAALITGLATQGRGFKGEPEPTEYAQPQEQEPPKQGAWLRQDERALALSEEG